MPPVSVRASRRSESDPDESASTAPESAAPPRVDSLIPQRPWLLWVLGGLGLLLWGATIAGGDWVDRTRPELAEVFGLASHRTVRFFSTLFLLMAGQFSGLILWYRTRSRKDFNGRYRIWFWAGLVWLTFCVAAATQFHHVLGRALAHHWQLQIARAEVLCWLAPAAAVMLSLTKLINREMRDCRPSRVMHRIAFCFAIATALVVLASPLIPGDRVRLLMVSSLATLWQLCLVQSLFLHARHVVYVTVEPSKWRPVPPGDRRRLPLRWLQQRLPKLKLHKLRVPGIPRLRRTRNAESAPAEGNTPRRLGFPKLGLRRPSFSKLKLPRLAFPKLALPKLALPKLSLPKLPSLKGSGDSTTAKTPGTPSKSAPKPGPRTPAGTAAAVARPALPTRPSPAAAKPATSRTEPPRRVDPPHSLASPKGPLQSKLDELEDDGDGDDQSGLSRKERKRLKKLQRQQDRSGPRM